jgi:hypothetical protein
VDEAAATLSFQLQALREIALALNAREDPGDARLLQAVQELIAEKRLEIRDIQDGLTGS